MHSDLSPAAPRALGTCEHDVPEPQHPPLSYVDMRLSARDMLSHWRRCSLTSDFLAGFLAAAEDEQDAARLELSMVIDELIENAVKFCADVREPLVVGVQHYGDVIRLEASNTCDRQRADELERVIRRVLESDLEALFLEQIEASAVHNPSTSGIGFITLCVNHGARIGARISSSSRDGLFEVTVRVLLDRREVAA